MKVKATETLELLDQLQALGLDDAAFARLHHHREIQKDETIASFLNYCKGKPDLEFIPDGNNERVHRRLKLVLNAYTSAGFQSGSPSVFGHLADAAYAELPACPGTMGKGKAGEPSE